MKDFIPRTVEERIVQAMARALWASCYANAWDNGELPADADHAGGGQDWMDHCGETPVRAYMAAAVFAEDLLRAAQKAAAPRIITCLWCVFADAMDKDPAQDCEKTYSEISGMEKDQEDFGHYTAMESMGHGVGWADDHEPLPFDVPNTLEHLSWSDLKD